MQKVLYKLCFLVASLMPMIPLSAQSITVTEADGISVGCEAFAPANPAIEVSSTDLTVTGITADLVVPSGFTIVRIAISHQENSSGSFGSSNGNFIFNLLANDPGAINAAQTMIDYDFILNSSALDHPEAINFIQLVLVLQDSQNPEADEVKVPCTFYINVIESAAPVELISFNGKQTGKTNSLNWQTASELNNSHFEIERSLDGNNFRQIGEVQGNGTAEYKIDYQYEDHNPVAHSYYRLKQVDYDGKFEYSDIISINGRSDKAVPISVFPNPARSVLNVSYFSDVTEEIDIAIVDLTGRVITSQIGVMESGTNNLELDCNVLPQGTYFLRFQSDNVNKNKLFIKQ